MIMKSVIFLLLCVSSVWSFNNQKHKEPYRADKNVEGRIINGMFAKDAEFPYMAAIWKTTSIGRYFCGGAVIDRQWILTSGDCVLDGVEFRIQLGSISLSNPDINRQNVTATTSIVHPDFDPETFINNIGLINLPQPLSYNDYVNAIVLPTEALPDNALCVTTGWGQIDDQHSGPVDALRRVYVITLINDHCKNFYGNQVADSMLCAMGTWNEGTCIGDIGGPLIELEGEQPIHVGIASFLSFNGCESLDPSGYERTYDHLDWIKSVTNIP